MADDDAEVITLILAAREKRRATSTAIRHRALSKAKAPVGTALAFCAWLGCATVFYSQRHSWTFAQSFFYAVDIGYAIGFGSMVEGEGVFTTPEFKADNGSMAYTIFHVLVGAMVVSGALAYFVSLMMEMSDRLADQAAVPNVDQKVRGWTRLVRLYKSHAALFKVVGGVALYCGVSAAIAAAIADYPAIQAVYFVVTSLSTAGLQGPNPSHQADVLFTAVFSLIGVPLFAVLIGQVSGVLIERWETERQYKKLNASVSEAEFKYAQKMMSGPGAEIGFREFLIMSLIKLGKLDDETLASIQKRFDFLDVDGDGTFSKTEMHAMLRFEGYDDDNSGELDIVEFGVLVEDMNDTFPGIIDTAPERVVAEFRRIDTSGDGSLDKREFLEWWKQKEKEAGEEGKRRMRQHKRSHKRRDQRGSLNAAELRRLEKKGRHKSGHGSEGHSSEAGSRRAQSGRGTRRSKGLQSASAPPADPPERGDTVPDVVTPVHPRIARRPTPKR